MCMRYRVLAGFGGFAVIIARLPASATAQSANRLTPAEQAAGWRLLFDGRTLRGWHGLGYATTPPGLWIIEDDAIARVPKSRAPVQADGQPLTGMDLVSDEAFQNFE